MKIIDLKAQPGTDYIKETLKILESGGLVIYPSDTVYGLLVDAANPDAVKKLSNFKNRPPGKPISVFVSSREMLDEYASIKKNQEEILSELLPGPFTVILDSRHMVVPALESEKGALGLRIPDYEPVNKLTAVFGRPVTATSANLSGRPPHHSVETLLKELPESKKQLLDLIVDAGKLPRNKPSTIVDLSSPEIKILRKGDIPFKKSKTYLSESAAQTSKIGEYLLTRYKKYAAGRPLVFIIEGELGAGKTVLVKGMGKSLGITDIISPTYVIYYEYGNFYHFDLYSVTEKNELKYLGIDKLLKPGNVLAFEWGEKAGEINGMLKNKAKVILIKMEYINENGRKLTVEE